MKTICFYFQIHQPFRLKRYRFFDIGRDHYYYDDFNNEEIITKMAYRSYIPANQTLLEMIKSSGYKFKVAFSISGLALEQMEIYVPEFIDGMKELLKTGCVEILSETYAHSLASLEDPIEFERQVKQHSEKIVTTFGVRPKVFRNTELIYSDEIGALVAAQGFTGMLIEGAKHVLGWKSPNYVYNCSTAPKLKLLLKNFKLSDDISFRFNNHNWNEYPLTADKLADWVATMPVGEQVVNLFMGYDVMGGLQPTSSGIFEFFKALPHVAASRGITFSTPSEIFGSLSSVDQIHVPYPMSWADEERDTSAWLGNSLQKEAVKSLYSISERVRLGGDRRLLQDWNYLQSSDHFYYMCTKRFSDGAIHSYYSPYDTPFEAFTNYMNILSDFIERVNEQFPSTIENEELNSLLTTIHNQALEIQKLKEEIKTSRSKTTVEKAQKKEAPEAVKKRISKTKQEGKTP